jgi:hypothetical protein
MLPLYGILSPNDLNTAPCLSSLPCVCTLIFPQNLHHYPEDGGSHFPKNMYLSARLYALASLMTFITLGTSNLTYVIYV